MKKTSKKIMIVLMMVAMVWGGMTVVDAASPTDVLPTPVVTANKKTARIGEEITFSLTGLDFETASDDPIRDDYQFIFFTEKFSEAYQIKDITIPMIRSTDVDYFEVTLMTIYEGGRDWVVDPIKLIPGETESITYTRAQILDWVENTSVTGVFPSEMYFLFQPIKNGEHVPTSSMSLDGPIQFTYSMVDAPAYGSDNSAGFFQGRTTWVYDAADYDESNRVVNKVDSRQYFETSNVTITASKATDLVPGEEIDLTFTINNTSTAINNKVMWIGMEAIGLELAGENTDFNWSNIDEDNFTTPLYLGGAWVKVDAGTSYTFTRRFKVRADYPHSSIDVNPFLYINGDFAGREVDPKAILDLYVAPKYAIKYDLNGGTGDVPTDEKEYLVEETTTLLQNTAVKDGYEFTGWNTQADGKGTAYAASSEVAIEELMSPQRAVQDIVLYATWKKAAPVTPVTPEKPGTPGTGTGSEGSQEVIRKVNVAPNTGDQTQAIALLTIASAALVAMMYVVYKKRQASK